jgi:hypothetical protein
MEFKEFRFYLNYHKSLYHKDLWKPALEKTEGRMIVKIPDGSFTQKF